MNKQKIMLSVIGLAALIIPVVLLIIFTNKTQSQPAESGGSRNIDPNAVEEAVKKIPAPSPIIPSPSPASIPAEFQGEGNLLQ